MKNIRQLTIILAVCTILIACGENHDSKASTTVASSTNTEKILTMGTQELTNYLNENAGTPTILLFWTTWCPSCKEELPELRALQQSHGDSVNIITVSLDEDATALENFVSRKDIGLPVYHGTGPLAQRFNVAAIPTLVMFDKTGKQIFSRAGIFPHAMLTKMTEQLKNQ